MAIQAFFKRVIPRTGTHLALVGVSTLLIGLYFLLIPL